MCCLALLLLSYFGGVSQINWCKTTFPFNKIEIQASGKFTKFLLLPFALSVLTVCKTNLITARACKNKHSVRMLTNAHKDHSMLLWEVQEMEISQWKVLDFFLKLTFHTNKTFKNI